MAYSILNVIGLFLRSKNKVIIGVYIFYKNDESTSDNAKYTKDIIFKLMLKIK